MGPTYFAYGANMDTGHMHGRVPGATDIGRARLDGFRLVFSVYSSEWEGGAANLAPDRSGRVWGLLWDVPRDEVQGLDAFQGHPTFFRREEVVVESDDEPIVAWTYRVAHQEGTYIRPTDVYLDLLREAMRTHGFPEEALEDLERAARPPKPTIST